MLGSGRRGDLAMAPHDREPVIQFTTSTQRNEKTHGDDNARPYSEVLPRISK
jgi:hypothetical protein